MVHWAEKHSVLGPATALIRSIVELDLIVAEGAIQSLQMAGCFHSKSNLNSFRLGMIWLFANVSKVFFIVSEVEGSRCLFLLYLNSNWQ